MTFIQEKMSSSQVNHSEANDNNTLIGNFKGKSVIKIDPSYQKKQTFLAGMGAGTFEGLAEMITVVFCAFTALVASGAVGIATGAMKPALITLGIGGGVTLFVALLVFKS